MAMHLIAMLFDALRPDPTPPGGDVHFHTGPQGRPAVCHADACSRPRLQVD